MAMKHHAPVHSVQCEDMQNTHTHAFTHILCLQTTTHTGSVMHTQIYVTILTLTVHMQTQLMHTIIIPTVQNMRPHTESSPK